MTNNNTLYKPLDIERNRDNEPTTVFTHRHTRYLELLGALRDKSFQTLQYNKELTAYNQSSNSVHIKGSKGEFILVEYADGTMDVMPKEDGDDGYDLQSIILAPEYPNEPVSLDVKAAAWGYQPDLLVRVDTEPSADYYVNVSLDEDGDRATIQGITPRERVYGNDISKEQAVENLLEQYHNMSNYKQGTEYGLAQEDRWGEDADPETEIRRLVNHNANLGRRITDTLHLSHHDILNYYVPYEDLDAIPAPGDFHPVEEPEPDHRNADLHELLSDLEQKNKTRIEKTDTTSNPDNGSVSSEPDGYVNGTPVHTPN